MCVCVCVCVCVIVQVMEDHVFTSVLENITHTSFKLEKVLLLFFYGGRLFQQWLVDVYVKIESMHLDWYSNPEHQKIIRADLYQVCYLPVTCTVFAIKPFFNTCQVPDVWFFFFF